VFFGTSAFAVPALRAFARAGDCRLVVTQPDRPSGRGRRMTPTPVKAAALELGIATIEPEKLRDAFGALREAQADLFAVASYGKIISQAILDLPRLGALNVHPSLLPLYRGATPLQAQLRDGVTTGGVTIILMDAGMDTGDIVLQERLEIGTEETYGELHDRSAEIGARLLATAATQAIEGSLTRTPQAGLADAERVAATLTRPLASGDLEVDWSWPSKRIVDFVRSLSPAPSARAVIAGERVKILHAHVGAGGWTEFPIPPDAAPGSPVFAFDESVLVMSGDGFVAIDRVVPPNRSAMSGAAYAMPKIAKGTV
jgi:methionyl-tRNA formyltransferase